MIDHEHDTCACGGKPVVYTNGTDSLIPIDYPTGYTETLAVLAGYRESDNSHHVLVDVYEGNPSDGMVTGELDPVFSVALTTDQAELLANALMDAKA